MTTPNHLWQEVDGEVLPPDPQDLPEGDPNAPEWTPQDRIMPHDPASTPVAVAAPDFTQRNRQLKILMEPKGVMSQLGKREQAVRFEEMGWSPPELAKYQSTHGKHAKENYERELAAFYKKVEAACGSCALRDQCELSGEPAAFGERFHKSGTRAKLFRRIVSSDPAKQAVKCDDITPSK